MSRSAPPRAVLPESDQFREWAQWAIRKLGLSSSELLNDGRPGGKNKVRTSLKLTKHLKLDFCKELTDELHRIADRDSIDIGDWKSFAEKTREKGS
jgi:hypothetical protein